MAPEMTTKADNLIIALGRLAAAQERRGGMDLEVLFQSASAATDEIAGLLGLRNCPEAS